ncbi:hypothetical protein GCM10023238_10170 [Streptomyces heliomycini]
MRLEVRDGGLHHLGGLEHERQLHLAGAEQLTDHLHAVQEGVVDDVEGLAGRQGLVQVLFEAVLLSVDDPPLEALLQGRAASSSALPAFSDFAVAPSNKAISFCNGS